MSDLNKRRWWLRVHRWLGLFLLLLSLPVGVTGSLNVYHREIDAWLNPDFYRPRAVGAPLPLNTLLQAARRADPAPVISIILPDAYWPVLLVHQRHGPVVMRTSLDPVSGEILGRRDQTHALLPSLYQLHRNLLLKPFWGEELVGVSGLALALSAGSGLWLWRPRSGRWRQALRVRRGQNLFRTTWDLHSAGGFWVSLILLLVGLSGAAMTFPQAARRLVNGTDFKPTSVARHGRAPDADPDGILAAARRHRPQDVPLVLVLPTERLNTWRVAMRPGHYHGTVGGLTQLWIDPWSYRVAQEKSSINRSPSDTVLAHQFPLHNGSLGGEAGRFLVFLSGLAFPLLGVSGAYLWWRKRSLEQRASLHKRRTMG